MPAAAHAERDAIVVLRFRPAKRDAALKAELKRASKQQRLLARTLPYQQHAYTLEEHAAGKTVRQKIDQRLAMMTQTLTSSIHVGPSYKDEGISLNCATTDSEHKTARTRSRNPKKKAAKAKRKEEEKRLQPKLTVDGFGAAGQQSGKAGKCVHQHLENCPCSMTVEPDVQLVNHTSKIDNSQPGDGQVFPTPTEPAIIASRSTPDTLPIDSRDGSHHVPSSVITESEKPQRLTEKSSEGYSLVDAPGQRPLSEILEKKRIYSSLIRRLENERLEICRTRAQLDAIHRELKIAKSPAQHPLLTTEATLDRCSDADRRTCGRTNVDGDKFPGRLSIDEAAQTNEQKTVNKDDDDDVVVVPRSSASELRLDYSSHPVTDTHKECYNDGGMESRKHMLFERLWTGFVWDEKEVLSVPPNAPSHVKQKSRYTKSLVSCGKKIKGKMKRLLHVKGKDPISKSQDDAKNIIHAWSESVTQPWKVTSYADLNYATLCDQWIDEVGWETKKTLPGKLASPTITDVMSPRHVPKLSNFRNKEELWLYLHPESVGNVPNYRKSMNNESGLSSPSSTDSPSENRAELPAYDEVMSADARVSLGASEAQNARSKVPAHCSNSFPKPAPIRPEDLWLYAPRSCNTCGDFGLLPLHYCNECKKLRIDMCSECYGMDHDSCKRDGHDVSEECNIQEFRHSAKSSNTILPKPAVSEHRPENIGQSQILEQLLKFLTEERSFMRSEIERARSESKTANMRVSQGEAGTAALRTAKLRLLPTLITNEQTGNFNKPKSQTSILDSLSNQQDSTNIDKQPAGAKDESLSMKPERAGRERKILQTPSEHAEPEQKAALPSVPNLNFAATETFRPQNSAKEFIDMDAQLRKQEQLQEFRERELCLREKEFSLRERERLLDLKERELVKPGCATSEIIPQARAASGMSSTMSTYMHPSNYVSTRTEVPRCVLDATTEDLISAQESPVSCAEASRLANSVSPSDVSRPQTPIVTQHTGFSLRTLLFKHLMSKMPFRAPRKGIRTHAEKRNRPSGSSDFAATAKKSKTDTAASGRKTARKLPLSRNHSARSDRSGTDSGSNKRRKKVSATKAVRDRFLVCPYAKYDPYRYSSSNTAELHYRRCGSHTLRDIPRLKQHLYRVHQRPEFHCPRCYSDFASMTEAGEHARQPTQCAIAPCPYPEKFDNDQLRELKKRQQGKNEADCWISIFKILFPDVIPPADPYMEDCGSRLAAQLGSYGASDRFAQMVTRRAGTMDDKTRVRVRQAIQELLPEFVQQALQPPVTSAHSSTTSLPRSSTTSESSPLGDQSTVAEHQWKHPHSEAFFAPRNVEQSVLHNGQPAAHLSATSKGSSSANLLSPGLGAATALQSNSQYFGRQATKTQHPDTDQHLGRQSANLFIPTLETSAQQSVTAPSLHPNHTSVPIMAPPPIPQFVPQEMTLTQKGSRRSMDSGYTSMYPQQVDELDGPACKIYNENVPNSGNTAFATSPLRPLSQDLTCDLQCSHWAWSESVLASQDPASRLDHFNSGANKHNHVLDSHGDRQGVTNLINYSKETHPFFRPISGFSDTDPFLPSMTNTWPAENFNTTSLPETIEDLWAAVANGNPWRQGNTILEGESAQMK